VHSAMINEIVHDEDASPRSLEAEAEAEAEAKEAAVAAAEAVAPAPAGAEAGAEAGVEARNSSLGPGQGAGAGGIRQDDVKVELKMTKSLKNVLVHLGSFGVNNGGGVKDLGRGVIENSARPTLNLLLLFRASV